MQHRKCPLPVHLEVVEGMVNTVLVGEQRRKMEDQCPLSHDLEPCHVTNVGLPKVESRVFGEKPSIA